MRIAQEEVFGPVLSIIKFKDNDKAAAIANNVRFERVRGPVVDTQLCRRPPS